MWLQICPRNSVDFLKNPVKIRGYLCDCGFAHGNVRVIILVDKTVDFHGNIYTISKTNIIIKVCVYCIIF